MSKTHITEQIRTFSGDFIALVIYPESGEDTLTVLSQTVASQFCEAPIQIQEGCSYEYKLQTDYQFAEIPGVVKRSRIPDSTGGRITPGNNTGTIFLEILNLKSNQKCGEVSLEVRSSKTTYREDYRLMLEDITQKSTSIMLDHRSISAHTIMPDFEKEDQITLYQRFAFINSLINTSDFNDAIARILTSPTTGWKEVVNSVDITRINRINRQVVKQIVSGSNRISVPETHPIKHKFFTLPGYVTRNEKRDTPDIPENQFIKHVLTTFYLYLSIIKNRMSPETREYKEALLAEEHIGHFLTSPLMKEISQPNMIPLNSPVLQRKEGYREIYRIWLLFELAAKLTWQGGDDVYRAGKRDVATLYEYWLFFKLLDLLNEIFKFEPGSITDLIEETDDKLGLKLRSGKYIPIKGIFNNDIRNLNIEFSYNRTFSGSKEYPQSGSWTKSMRPDYSLSIWPAELEQKVAEGKELIIHIHFDAKYKVSEIKDVFGDLSVPLDDPGGSETITEKEYYKRTDLLKMHAYKDAVRRTAGAYILYPGTEKFIKEGFHEVIPGLGAFPVRPIKGDDGTEHLKKFILDVINHFINRTTQQERLSYHVYDIFKEKPGVEIRESLPEIYETERVKPPVETSVIIGFIKNSEHIHWVNSNGLYNFRMESDRGSLRLSPIVSGAEFLLLHSEGEIITGDIRRIKVSGPTVYSKDKLIKMKYPNPEKNYYLVFEIEKTSDAQFKGHKWDITKLEGYLTGRASGLPFAITLDKLMQAVIKD